MSSQRAGDRSSVAERPTNTTNVDRTSPLTAVASGYGAMDFNNRSNVNAATTTTTTTTTTTRDNSATPTGPTISPWTELPKPAVRRKIQSKQSAEKSIGGTYPRRSPPSNEKMSAINDSSQATGEQRPGLADGLASQLDERSPTLGLVLPPKGQQLEKEDANEHELVVADEQQAPTRPYPKKVLFIIANEFCERFSYYGLRTVLVLYFKSVLGFTDSGSTISFHLFATLCYFMPLFGAILSDSILGKYKTILYLSVVYFLGELILVMSSIFWNLNVVTLLLTWLGLLLIGIGTGGIKPCVAAFAGDQFLPNEQQWREDFFSLFYGAINLGSLISMFLTPLLRSNYGCFGRNDCYPLAFGLPCLLLFVATIMFILARKHYYRAPLPKDNIILAFCQCTWLALRRKMSGHKLPQVQLMGNINHSLSENDSSLSSSRLSMTSSENETKPVAPSQKIGSMSLDNNQLMLRRDSQATTSETQRKRNHWLYLASDRFDTQSIEEFKSVLGLLLLFLPTPVYWCLFDQQGSLWTLQATRMDGRLFGGAFLLEPDQMTVANPVLLLTAIPIFQLVIYPTLNRCNLITTPIKRMTTGGLLAALSFVASALIEFQIQASQPGLLPPSGHVNLLLVNGLSECGIAESIISLDDHKTAPFMLAFDNGTEQISGAGQREIGALEPLATRRLDSLASLGPSQVADYKLSFRLTTNKSETTNPFNGTAPSKVVCPLDTNSSNHLSIGPLMDQDVKLLYIDQGNGKLTYKLFNDSLALPEANKARVRLLYEFFGSYSNAQRRQFHLVPLNGPSEGSPMLNANNQFRMSARDGQVLLSDYLDVEISPANDRFIIQTNDSSLKIKQQLNGIKLEAGTRNLIILHQLDATNVRLDSELLQDNNYRISMLYQLIPYTMISMSEVMFSITGIEFSYAMAPPNLKSLILGFWYLTTAVGNILTVAVESSQPFSNLGHDFLFYAALMTGDMILFAILGYYYEPYKSGHSA